MKKRIKEHRERLGLSQQDLADKVGVDGSLVCCWESGKRLPSTKLLPALAYALECRVGDLYDPEDLAIPNAIVLQERG